MSHKAFRQILRCIALALLVVPSASVAEGFCEAAADRAAKNSGVPLAILRAVTLAETGRSRSGQHGAALRPWPWTVHSDGRGHWFASRQEALQFVAQQITKGQSNIDIGCFQINLHWHGAQFRNIDQMFDPQANADYAAEFLLDLFSQTQDWRRAVGQYHSRSADKSTPYLQRLERLYAAHLAIPVSDEPAQPSTPEFETIEAPPKRYSLIGARGPLLAHRSALGPLIGAMQ